MSYVRRTVGGALTALLAASALAACGAGESDDAGGEAGWSYTSGNGERVTLDKTPERIIASGAEAAALISFGIKPVGIYANGPVEEDANLKDLDLSGITILGETWGEIDVEKAASLKPDLIVADWWPAEKAYSGLEEGAKASSKNVVELADDVLYVANPEHAPELLDLQRWGLDVIDPDKPDKGFPYWENLSWENADKYQPDLLLVDDRTYESTLKQGEEQPTWSTIKAADAKAYVPWPAYWMHTYGEYAEQLTQLTAAIEKADPELA